MLTLITWIVVALVVFVPMVVRVLKEWERGVVLQLGRLVGLRGPGLTYVIPIFEKLVPVDTRVITMDIPSQDVITLDNVSLKVNAVIYFRVVNPEAAISKIEDYYFATSQLAQTTLRSVAGQYAMDDLLQHREKINTSLQSILDKQTDAWGVKITGVEVKHIDLPVAMQRAMAKQAEAERERRAKVITAEGEMERSSKLAAASRELAESPSAMQLAYLQAMNEISNEGKTTIVLPIPIDILEGIKSLGEFKKSQNANKQG